MKPKDKAYEIWDKYYTLLPTIDANGCITEEQVKQCALIVVDGLLDHVNIVADDAAIEYWEEVKTEIEKL